MAARSQVDRGELRTEARSPDRRTRPSRITTLRLASESARITASSNSMLLRSSLGRRADALTVARPVLEGKGPTRRTAPPGMQTQDSPSSGTADAAGDPWLADATQSRRASARSSVPNRPGADAVPPQRSAQHTTAVPMTARPGALATSSDLGRTPTALSARASPRSDKLDAATAQPMAGAARSAISPVLRRALRTRSQTTRSGTSGRIMSGIKRIATRSSPRPMRPIATERLSRSGPTPYARKPDQAL